MTQLLGRRGLLKLGAGALGVGLTSLPGLGWAADAVSDTPSRAVSFHNLHTGESMDGVYWEQGDYIPEVLDAVNHLLRDYRTGEVRAIDPRLLDLLDSLTTLTGTNCQFQVISGYRSAQTNAMLHEESAEVAKHSFHIQGQAIDIRLADVDLPRLHAAAISLGRGGVGLYPVSNFVHVDVGPVRAWRGT